MNEPFPNRPLACLGKWESLLRGTQHGMNQHLFFSLSLDSNSLLMISLFHCLLNYVCYPMKLCPIGNKGTRLHNPRSNVLSRISLGKKHSPSQPPFKRPYPDEVWEKNIHLHTPVQTSYPEEVWKKKTFTFNSCVFSAFLRAWDPGILSEPSLRLFVDIYPYSVRPITHHNA